MEHLKTGSLIEYAEDLLAGNGTSDLDSHLQKCSQCAAAASEWLGLLGLIRATPLQSGPEDAVRKCKSLYHLVGPVYARETTVSDALGEFRFANILAGKSSIRAQLPSGVCVIGSFVIRTEDNRE